MRVLQVINRLGTGGAEKLILDSVPMYQKKGLTVDLLLLQNVHTEFRSELNKISNGTITGLTTKSLYNPLLILKIIPHIKKYDLIHLHLFPTLYWVVLAKWLSFSKVKLIYTEHNTNNRRRDNFLFKIIDRFIYQKIDVVTSITEGVKLELQKHLKNETEIQVINNGINVGAFNLEFKKEFNYFSNNDFKLIQVSSFREQKDQLTIIRSLVYLPEKVKLLLVGDGPLIEDNKKLVEELKLSNRVVFLGNRYDIPELMNYADIAILSSHWEGFGLAVLEGMAAKKPVIASDVDGVREIVEGYGLLFEQGNEKELAKHIISLINDQEYYNKIALQCFNRAKGYDISKMVDKYIEVYDELIRSDK